MDKFKKTRTHFRENKKVYAVGAGCLAGGVVGTLIFKSDSPLVSVKEITLFGMKWHSPTSVQIVLPALGDPGNVVQCLETLDTYPSQGEAARKLGASAARVSDHLTGKIPHVNGYHLQILGKAGHPIAN